MGSKKLPYFHLRLSKFLEAEGYVVLPVRCSDYPVDLLAVRNGKTKAYKCKFHGKVYKPEMEKLRLFSRQTGIDTYIAKENGAREIYFLRCLTPRAAQSHPRRAPRP